MPSASQRPRRVSVCALFILLALIVTSAFPVMGAGAASVKAATQKGTYTVKDAVRGIDVSKWNGTINWKKVAQDNVEFVFCRATYGAENDPTFVTNAKGAHENGLYVGAYHFSRFKDSASVKKEAAAFLKQIKKVTLTYPVVLDIENHYNLSKKKLTSLALEFVQILQQAGYKVMIYTYQNFYRDRLNVSSLSGYDLWVANYVEKPSGIDHVLWQNSSSGKVSGIRGKVDLNVAYKNLSTKKKKSSASQESVICAFLNEQYGAGLDSGSLTRDEADYAIACGFQTEINKQLGGNVTVNGSPADHELGELSAITFTPGKTKGRITTLIQSKLYLMSHIDAVNGQFDDATVRALESLQAAYGLESNGQMTKDTWAVILGLY